MHKFYRFFLLMTCVVATVFFANVDTASAKTRYNRIPIAQRPSRPGHVLGNSIRRQVDNTREWTARTIRSVPNGRLNFPKMVQRMR